jgi:hypothetical protein
MDEKISEQLLNDLILSIAVLSKGMFFESLDIINSYFDTVYDTFNYFIANSTNSLFNADLLIKLKYLLLLSTELITFNQKLLLEPEFVEKIMDSNERDDLKLSLENEGKIEVNV